ncbi:hypothetical protein GE061_006828 [Apolygus lucorum]|uniref:IQ motif and ubiquitin-like domain-containing protein n=1 Tax=Apolygus lucorum TaxID=248454 RepID=A0A6A4J4R8_APOLU|nr:hypothetical protein GE061_006828 [Apolygus lucorum]
MEVQTGDAGMQTGMEVVREGVGEGLVHKDWYVETFMDQILQRVPEVVIGPDREAVTVVRGPGVLDEAEDLGVEDIEEEERENEEEEVDRASSPLSVAVSKSKESASTGTGASRPSSRSSSRSKAVKFSGFEDDEQKEDTAEAGRGYRLLIEGDVEEKIPMKPGTSLAATLTYISERRGTTTETIKLTPIDKTVDETETLGHGDVRVDFVDVASETMFAKSNHRVPKFKVVDVKIQREDGSWVTSKVAMINCGARKQYLGGFRNKRTGEVYYHVWSQTNPRINPVKMVTREVQTNLPIVDTGNSTVRVITTQTWTPGLWIPNNKDRFLTPRRYVGFDEKLKTMSPHAAATIIQTAWRKYQRKKELLHIVENIHSSWKTKTQFEYLNKLDFERQHLQLMVTQGFPTTRNDFSNLFGVVNQWAVDEATRLMGLKTTINRKAALVNLLRDEVKMLFDLETLRIRSKTENLQKQDVMFLEGTARSRACTYPEGNVTLVDDLNIQKARMFKEMFASYKRTDATTTERLDMLNCFQATLNDYFEPERQIMVLIELLEREVDMIIMGIADEHLVYLRKRFETLFLDLMRDPSVNPQAKYYRKSAIPAKKYSLSRCVECQKILEPYKMFMTLMFKKFTVCKSCMQMRQNSVASMNLAPYQRILEYLRASELEKIDCRSPIAFLLQPFGTYFVVQVLWQGKCMMTGSDYLPGLRLTRWLPDKEWSMWNTILLAESEVAKHERIANPIQHYDESFVLKVRIRNLLGRLHYGVLEGIDIHHPEKIVSSVGILPKNHRLYVNKNHQNFIPKLKKPEFFYPT